MKSNASLAAAKPRLRVALKDVDTATFSAELRDTLGKQRGSIVLDTSVIAFYKAKAGNECSQTMPPHHARLQSTSLDALGHKTIKNH